MQARKIVLLLQGILLVQILVAGSVSLAEVYKWVDENGKVHFGDKAPEKQEAINIESELKNKENIDESSKNFKRSSASKGKKTADEELVDARKRKSLEESIGDDCRQLEKEIELIASGKSVTFHNAEGHEYVVPERDRDKKLQEWQEQYADMGCEELSSPE